MNSRKWLSGISVSAQVAFAVGCGAGNMTTPVMQTQSGTVFVSGSDAPLPGIVSFKAIISGTSVAEGSKTPVTVTTGPQTVDFARLKRSPCADGFEYDSSGDVPHRDRRTGQS